VRVLEEIFDARVDARIRRFADAFADLLDEGDEHRHVPSDDDEHDLLGPILDHLSADRST
jgi:hypothetical protein